MASEQDSWIHRALGVDVGSVVSKVESAADTVTSAASTAASDLGTAVSFAADTVTATASSAATGPDSASYQRGYQDGVSGEESNPGPVDGDYDYQEGYAKGHYEFSQKNASKVPDGPKSSQGPPDAPAPPPPAAAATGSDSASYQRGYQDGVSGEESNPGPVDGDYDYQEDYAKGHYEFSQKKASQVPDGPNSCDPGPNQCVTTDEDRAAYQKGYQDGLSGADEDPIGRVGFQYAQDYTSGYNAGKADRPNVPVPPSPMPAPPSPNTNPPGSKAWLSKEIEDLGGDCYDPDAMSYDDLKQKYEELKQRSPAYTGPQLEQGKPITRGKDAEDPFGDLKQEWHDTPPEEDRTVEIIEGE